MNRLRNLSYPARNRCGLAWLMFGWLAGCGGCDDSSVTDGPELVLDAGVDASVARDGGLDGSVAKDAASERDATLEQDAAMADAGPALPLCTDGIGSCPASISFTWSVLLDAQDFGEDARLVVVGQRTVVVAHGDGTFSIAYLRAPSDYDAVEPYVTWDFPVPAGQLPVAIVDGRGLREEGQRIFVLTCDDTHVNCSLWQANDVENSGLAMLQEMVLPPEFQAIGVALDRSASSSLEADPPCVYGAGMMCFKEGWQEAIAPASGLMFNDVVLAFNWSVAVGDHGRWFLRDRDAEFELNAWQEQPALEDVKLTQVSAMGAGAAITGEGRVQAMLGVQAEQFVCAPAGELITYMLHPQLSGVAFTMTKSGQVLHHSQGFSSPEETYCASQDLSLQDEIIQVGVAPCNGSINPRILTKRKLYGANRCVIID